jgi:putative toxin-antitoxin system antitoxin component (TIGR02293 family)
MKKCKSKTVLIQKTDQVGKLTVRFFMIRLQDHAKWRKLLVTMAAKTKTRLIHPPKGSFTVNKKSRSVSSVVQHSQGSFRDTTRTISKIKSGLPVKVFFALKDQINVSAQELAHVVGIAPRTLLRRKQEGRLQKEESERVIRLQRLFEKALDVFEDRGAAQLWFNSPQLALGEKTPLDYADTELGAREVENLLSRIEHGVFV